VSSAVRPASGSGARQPIGHVAAAAIAIVAIDWPHAYDRFALPIPRNGSGASR
jgi:hypothetical protein